MNLRGESLPTLLLFFYSSPMIAFPFPRSSRSRPLNQSVHYVVEDSGSPYSDFMEA